MSARVPASALNGMLLTTFGLATSEGECDAEPKFTASLAPETLATKADVEGRVVVLVDPEAAQSHDPHDRRQEQVLLDIEAGDNATVFGRNKRCPTGLPGWR